MAEKRMVCLTSSEPSGISMLSRFCSLTHLSLNNNWATFIGWTNDCGDKYM